MKKPLILFLMLTIPALSMAESGIMLPYEEFKQLYGESITKRILEATKKAPFRHSVDKAFYALSLTRDGALCEIDISGAVLSGDPEPFELFNNTVIIKQVIEVSGGALLCSPNRDGGIGFLSSGDPAFRIKLSCFIPSGEDNQSRFVSMDIPGALANTLSLATGKKLRVTDAPGVKDVDGLYHFSTRPSLKIRFREEKQGPVKSDATTESLSETYKAVDTPPLVLDEVSCFTSFEENGSALSLIVINVPPEAGDIFKIKAIPESTLWSCSINGKRIKVYNNGEKDLAWVIPLEKGTPSHLELAVLTQGNRLGLSGRLEVCFPEMGLPARKATMAVGLPPRVELISFEGPVSTDTNTERKAPREFIGKPYYFARSFYKGESMRMSITYKEPVE